MARSRSLEQPGHGSEQAAPTRERVKRVITQVRGERNPNANTELLSIADEHGNEQLVRTNRRDAGTMENRINFDHIARTVAKTGMMHEEEIFSILKRNETQLTSLAGQQEDPSRALAETMRGISVRLAEAKQRVEAAVEHSGYTGMLAEGLRETLLEESDKIFGKALAEMTDSSARGKPDDKKNPWFAFDHSVKKTFGKIVDQKIENLERNVGTPPQMLLWRMREKMKALDGLGRKEAERANKLDEEIKGLAKEWARMTILSNPKISLEELNETISTEGLDEFITNKEINQLHRKHANEVPLKFEEYDTPTDRTDDVSLRRQKQTAEYLRNQRQRELERETLAGITERLRGGVNSAPDLPEDAVADWITDNEAPPTPLSLKKTVLPKELPPIEIPTPPASVKRTVVPSSEAPPRTTSTVRYYEADKPGAMQRIASWGRKKLLPLAVLFGLGASRPTAETQPAPERERTEQRAPTVEPETEPVLTASEVPTPDTRVTARPEQAPAKTEIGKLTAARAKEIAKDPKAAVEAIGAIGTPPPPTQPRAAQRAHLEGAAKDMKALQGAVRKEKGLSARDRRELEKRMQQVRDAQEIIRKMRGLEI